MRQIVIFVFLTALSSPAVAGSPLKVLSATVKDQVIPGAELFFQRTGQTTLQAATEASGSAALPEGAVDDVETTLIIKKDGYSSLVVRCPCAGMVYALSPKMTSLDGFRAVLSWGPEPADLDSHLVSVEDHIFFDHKEGRDGNLDVDDVSSFGPETITVPDRRSGLRYVYAIHNYSDRKRHTSKRLSQSGARVFVYVGETLVRTYTVEPARAGTLWLVFGVDEAGGFYDIQRFASATEREEVKPLLLSHIKDPTGATPMVTDSSKKAARGLTTSAIRLHKQGKFDEAISLYQEALQFNPEDAFTLGNMGLTFQKAGRTAEAIWASRKSIALATGSNRNNTQAAAYFNIACLYESKKQWSQAKESFERALALRDHPAYRKGIERVKAALKTSTP